MSNVFDIPINKMTKAQVEVALTKVISWAEVHGWDNTDDDDDLTARERHERLIKHRDQLGKEYI